VILVAAVVDLSWLGSAIVKPVQKLTDFAEKLASGDYKSKAEIETSDDFGYIAENLNRSMEKAARAVANQDAQEGLQRSVTEFLTIVSQIARGDLTLRGKVTNDALGNVVDSVNYMLDNFTRQCQRDPRLFGRHVGRRNAAGPGDHQHLLCRRRAYGIDETGFEQCRSQRRGRAPCA
jgi:methyl-accepting chemotaxis protein